MTFITGLRVEEVYADFKTFHPIRKKPAKPLETFTGKIAARPKIMSTSPSSPKIMPPFFLHYENGVRGVLTVSQVCSGRKNRLFFEINGSKSSLAWDGEHPNELVDRHRTEPNQMLMKDPSLLLPKRTLDSFLSRRTCRRFPGYIQTTLQESLQLYSGRRFRSKHPISRLLPMVIMKWYCVKPSNEVPSENKWIKIE